MNSLAPLLGLLLLASPAPADVSLFEGPAGGPGNVVQLDEAGVLPPVRPAPLQGITLLPIDCTGRTRLEALLPGRPQRRELVGGAARLELPSVHGSVYRFRRDDPGGSVFGYFLVRPDGSAESVFEIPGTGPTGAVDPIPFFVAIDPVADTLLIATTRAAGGNLIELDLASATAVDRTATHAPLRFEAGGLRLLSEWGVALTGGGALRFERASAADAELVPYPRFEETVLAFSTRPQTHETYVGEGVVASADEGSVAFVAGFRPDLAHVVTLRRAGLAERVTELPRRLEGAGFLPNCELGPTLALAPDGSCVSFRSVGVSREAWTRSTLPSSAPAFQVTADVRFVDTLGETGVIGFLSPTRLLLLVGEQGNPGIDGADAYVTDITTGQVQNLTLTSGQTATPFVRGTISTEDGAWQVPDGSGMIVLDCPPLGACRLVHVPFSGLPSAMLLDRVKSVEGVSRVGADLVFDVRRDDPGRMREVVRWLAALPGQADVLSSVSDDCDFVASIGQDAGTWAGVLSCPWGEFLGRVDVASGQNTLIVSEPLVFGRVLGTTPSGALMGSAVLGPRTAYFTWDVSGNRSVLALLDGPGHVLPGR